MARGARFGALLGAAAALFGGAAAARAAPGGLSAAAAAAAAGAGAGVDAPWFCHGLDCPRFEALGKGEGFEIRKYPAAKWASTEVKGIGLDKGMSTGFMRLFNYISGKNEAQVKIPMAAPVTARITPGAGPACEQDFVVSFFVPFADQANPTPGGDASPDVYIEDRAAMDTVYVASYGGWSSESSVISNAQKLAEALKKAGKAFDDSEFYYAGYDSPFRILRRHNEVWFRAAPGPAAEA